MYTSLCCSSVIHVTVTHIASDTSAAAADDDDGDAGDGDGGGCEYLNVRVSKYNRLYEPPRQCQL